MKSTSRPPRSCRYDRKLKGLVGLRSVTRSLRYEIRIVASSMSMPRCQPKRGLPLEEPCGEPSAARSRHVVVLGQRDGQAEVRRAEAHTEDVEDGLGAGGT